MSQINDVAVLLVDSFKIKCEKTKNVHLSFVYTFKTAILKTTGICTVPVTNTCIIKCIEYENVINEHQ